MTRETDVRRAMCEVGRRLWERGLIGAAEGNISARLESGCLLCTPSGVSKGHLEPEDLVLVLPDGRVAEASRPNLARSPRFSGIREPSSEVKLHLRALALRQDCGAVIHAHPPTATGLSLAGRTIPPGLLPEADVVLGPVALVPFAMPGTDEVPDAMEPFLAGHKTFLLSHHGAATLGRDLGDAFERMETLERVARIYLVAETLGGAQRLPDQARALLRERYLHGRLDGP